MTNTTAFASGKTLYLAKKLNPAGVLTLTSDPKVTHGRLFFKNDNQTEWINFTSVTLTSGQYVLGGLTRDIDPDTDPMTSLSTGKTWLATEQCILVEMHDQMVNKIEPTQIIQVAKTYATTAARDAALGGNGAALYDYADIKVTATGLFYNYNLTSGQWEVQGTGTATPNASTTVSGSVEIGNQTEVDSGTDTGGTGAYVAVIPSTFQVGITNRIATESQAETATNDTQIMTPLKTREADNVVSFTAGENISAGAPVYLNLTDSKVYNADGNVNNKGNIVGFAINTITTGNSVNVKTNGIFTTTGLTANSDYFLSDTVGTISTTPGTNVIRVGTAISTTQLLIDNRVILPIAYTISAANATDNISGSGGVYTKYKEIISPESGTYITTITATNVDGGGGGTVNFRIYKNGVAYGTERTIIGGGGTVSYTENLFFLKGDLIQLYAKASNGSAHTVSLLQIAGLFTSPTFAVINDN